MTTHSVSLRKNYVGDGDGTSEEDGSGPKLSYFWIFLSQNKASSFETRGWFQSIVYKKAKEPFKLPL